MLQTILAQISRSKKKLLNLKVQIYFYIIKRN